MPLLNEPKLLDENFDKDGRGTQVWEVECDKDNEGPTENPISILQAYHPETRTRVPQWLQPNEYMKGSGRPTIVTEATARRNGKIDTQFKVNITYGTPNEVQTENEKTETDNFQFPWDEPPDYSQDATTLSEFIYTQDSRGQPLLYSNWEPITNLVIPTPITIITVTKKRLATANPSSPVLADAYYRTVNNGNVTIRGVQYGPRRVLCESFPIELERYIKIDPETGNRTTIEYYVETQQFAIKKNTWATRVRDEGTYAKIVGGDDDGKTKGKSNDDKTRRSASPFNLNGNGEALGQDADETTTINTGTTPQGVSLHIWLHGMRL